MSPNESIIAYRSAWVGESGAGAPSNSAVQLAELGVLEPDLDTATAADVLWFYLGYTGMATLHEDSR